MTAPQYVLLVVNEKGEEFAYGPFENVTEAEAAARKLAAVATASPVQLFPWREAS